MNGLVNECIVGCKNFNGNFVIAKNRDRTYEPTTKIVHHTDKKNELVFLFDKTTHYVEGMNVKTGVCILNVAIENGVDFGDNVSSEGRHIFEALSKSKDAKEAIDILTKEKQEVYGNTMVSDGKSSYMLEFAEGSDPVAKDVSNNSVPTVRTNHTVYIPHEGYSLLSTPDMDYISSQTRKAVAEVMFTNSDNVEDLLDSLNYKLFGPHSAYDTNRDTSGYKTVSQIAIDPMAKTFYYRPIPGREKFEGVVRTGDTSIKPAAKVIILEYSEPIEIPFGSWSAGMHDQMEEGLKLHKLLDPDDEYSDSTGLSGTEQARMESEDLEKNLDYFISRENKIIRKLASIQDLLRNKDAAMLHLLADKDPEEEYKRICDLTDKAESQVMDLYMLKAKSDRDKAEAKNEAAKRIPRKKGQKKGSSKHSDLYTDENPKGTIRGLKFATVKDAETSVNKIKRSGRTHAHKVQAAVAMEQRAKAAGKKSAAGVYRSYINSVKKESVKSREGLMTEISKLPKEYFSKIDDAIRGSNFWTKDNSVSSIDAGPKGSLQSPAALSLETALQEVFDSLSLDIDAYVSTFDTDDESFQLNPGHPAYPNRWLIDAKWYVSKQRPGRNTIDLQIMPYGEEADSSDVDPSALVRHIAQTVRHELVHYTQMKKQSLSKGLYNDIEAFQEMLKDPKQVPDENNPKFWKVYEKTGRIDPQTGGEVINKQGFDRELYTQDYLKSHIEIDAHAHDAAEELLAVYGLEGSKKFLSGKIDTADPRVPNAIQHYIDHLPEDGRTVKELKKKIIKYLEYFTE